jgi:hypothetical protein
MSRSRTENVSDVMGGKSHQTRGETRVFYLRTAGSSYLVLIARSYIYLAGEFIELLRTQDSRKTDQTLDRVPLPMFLLDESLHPAFDERSKLVHYILQAAPLRLVARGNSSCHFIPLLALFGTNLRALSGSRHALTR